LVALATLVLDGISRPPSYHHLLVVAVVAIAINGRVAVAGTFVESWLQRALRCQEQPCDGLLSTHYSFPSIWVNYNDLTATEPWNHG